MVKRVYYGYSLVYGTQKLGEYASIAECRKVWKWPYIWVESDV